jgi:biopolymer transport protein ExbD
MSVYVKGQDEYYIEETKVQFADLQQQIQNKMVGQPDDGTVVLRADKDSPVQLIVNVIDAVNKINDTSKKKYKVILATKPQE